MVSQVSTSVERDGPDQGSGQAVRERWVDCDGLWVHTADWEPTRATASGSNGRNRGSGSKSKPVCPPILLVHGLGGSTVNWELVGGHFADALGTTVTALDLPGFGRTRSESGSPTFDVHAKLLAEFLEARGPAIVIGNSMGGALGVALAASHPELVSGLVLVNAALPRPRGNLEQLTRTAKFAALSAHRAATPFVRARARALGHEGLVDATIAIAFAHPEQLDPEIRKKMIALAAERTSFPETAASYTLSGGTLFRYLLGPMRRDIAAIHCPTLILHGRRDRLVPVGFARALARRRRDWPLVELDGCGHVPQLEQPDRFVSTVTAWLDRVPAVASTGSKS
jgi:pimeloyl-ACP methyl ester carboxylesterase